MAFNSHNMLACKRFLLIAVFIFTAHLGFSQNIVSNPSFEAFTSLPTGYGQWYKASGWSNLNLSPIFAWPYASPDYLHMTGGGGVDLPICTFGTVTPSTGSAAVGMVTWLSTTPNFREYFSIALTTPMIVGQAYTVTFQVTNGSAGWYCGYSSNHLGIQFSQTPLVQITNEPVGGTPQLECAGEIWSTTWQLVSFSYVADLPYTYIAIGNFYNDASTTSTFRVASFSAGAYYFLDDISVVPELPLPITFTAFDAFAETNAVNLNWQTSAEMNTDYFTVEKSANGDNFEAIGSVSAAGNSASQHNYQFTDYEPESGVNYYRIKTTDLDNSILYSEIKSVDFSNSFVNIKIYPNPCLNVLNISLPINNTSDIRIVDLSRQIVYTTTHVEGLYSINTSYLAAGVYIITIQNNNASYYQQFVKL